MSKLFVETLSQSVSMLSDAVVDGFSVVPSLIFFSLPFLFCCFFPCLIFPCFQGVIFHVFCAYPGLFFPCVLLVLAGGPHGFHSSICWTKSKPKPRNMSKKVPGDLHQHHVLMFRSSSVHGECSIAILLLGCLPKHLFPARSHCECKEMYTSTSAIGVPVCGCEHTPSVESF